MLERLAYGQFSMMDLDIGSQNISSEKCDEIASCIIAFVESLEEESNSPLNAPPSQMFGDNNEAITTFRDQLTKFGVPKDTVHEIITVCRQTVQSAPSDDTTAATLVSSWCLAFLLPESSVLAKMIASKLTQPHNVTSTSLQSIDASNGSEAEKAKPKYGNCLNCHKKTTKCCQGCAEDNGRKVW